MDDQEITKLVEMVFVSGYEAWYYLQAVAVIVVVAAYSVLSLSLTSTRCSAEVGEIIGPLY